MAKDGVTIKLSGLSELKSSLEEYSKGTARAIVTRTLKRAAEPMAEDARRLAPVDSGELRKGIVVEVARKNAGTAAYAETMRGGGSKADAAKAARDANRAAAGQGMTVTVSVRSTAYHSHLVEFGTVNTPPQPFMRQAYHGGRERAATSIKNIMADELSKAARRAASRALKKG